MSQSRLAKIEKLIVSKYRLARGADARRRFAANIYVAAIIAMIVCLTLLTNGGNLPVKAGKSGQEQKRTGQKRGTSSVGQEKHPDQIPEVEQEAILSNNVADNQSTAGKSGTQQTNTIQPQAAMTFTVTTTANDNGVCDASCSLREAITAANANVDPANPDTINFNIPGSGVQTITVSSALPTITDPVIINGYSQPGASPNTLANGNNAVLAIELNCNSSANLGINISAGNSTVRGLAINRCTSHGIQIVTNGNNTIAGNFVGIDPGGTVDRGNTSLGVGIFSSNNTIGGTSPADRNVISGNNTHGVQISGTSTVANTNKIQGNFIGTDITGTVALGNTSTGVAIFSSDNNLIGGTAAGARNVIAANLSNEINISGEPSDSNLVQGNIIGLDVTGNVELEAPLFTFSDGVAVVSGADNNTIGGTASEARNIISGANGDGIEINGSSATGNVIQGNYIGTDITGMAARGNGTGVKLNNVVNMTVGGTAAGAGNVISGNGFGGISIQGSSGSGNLVQGNLIGTDKNGTADVGNGSFGVIITGASNNTIGGTTAQARNVISGNSNGIAIEGALVDAGGNTIQGNYIGVDINGAVALGNSADGLSINFSPNNTIGGAAAGAGNIISNSQEHGVLIEGDASSGNNTVQSNTISSNGGDGVFVSSSAQNTIESNSIFANGGLGIDLDPDNVTVNDPSDPDTGPNNRQNFPILNLPVNSGGNTNISGTLNSTPSTQFRLEFFSSPSCDASGFGEGQAFVGTIDVTTLASGNINFNHIIPAIPAGHFLTATATAPNGDTSEFSQCAQEGPPAVSLAFSLATIDDSLGNSNGLIDVNECVSLNIELRNRGAVGATGISTVLSTTTPGITITQSNSNYPDIATGNTATNATPFKLSVAPDFGCGSPITLRLTSTTAQGVFITDFQVATNVPSVTSSFTASGPVAIPDDDEDGVDLPLNVSGISGPITKVRVKLHITHPVTGDLDISLVGPDGTTVFLSLGNGGNANYGTNCPADANDTIFDDDAETAISDGSNPFVGTFQPDELLAAFSNKSGATVNGTWKLNVADVFEDDTGSIQCWSLEIISPPAVTSTFAAAGPVAIPDNNPSGAELPVAVSGVTGPIAKVLVNLNIAHGSTDDLDISLVGPDGTTVNLSDDNGTGANYGTDCPADANDTIFDDAAEDPITFGDSPFTGTFRPEVLLSAFNGKAGAAVNGAWKLVVKDDETGTVGNIQCWTLTILAVTCANAGGVCPAPPAPEMNVKGNDVSIPDGDNSPSAADHTDFGSTLVNGGTVSRILTIENTGTVALNLNGTPKVTVGGANPADFSVTVQPSSPVSSGGGTTTFTVVFDPSAPGLRAATLSIANDDADENPYNFAIQGTGLADAINVSTGVSPSSADEDTGPDLVYTFTRNDTTGPLTVNFSVGGTATFNTDYAQSGAATFTASSGTVTFTAGSATSTVTVNPTSDSTDEPNETVILTVTSGPGYSVGSPDSATGTITDDDPLPSISISDVVLNEGNSGTTAFTFTVNLSNASSGTVTVNYATQNDSAIAPGDYTAISPAQTLTFVPGDTSEQFTVQVNGDTTVEADEAFFVNLSSNSANSTISDNQGVGTITNEETDVTLAVSPSSVAEDGATNLVYTFTRTGVTSGALTVNFSVGGDASFSTDYTQTGAATFTSSTGTVNFGAGNSTATVTIDPSVDSTVETDETTILTVTAGSGYNVASPSAATGTITNDDTDVTVAVAPASVSEDGATNLVYTFTRTGVTSGALTVNFSVAGDATFGTDYTQTGAATFTSSTGTVNFGAGNTTATVTVDPTTDLAFEANETVILTVTSGTGYSVGSPSQATGTITNDDPVGGIIRFSSATYNTTESSGSTTITVVRDGDTTQAVTVDYATPDDSEATTVVLCSTINGVASPRCDFTTALGTMKFAAGETSKTFTVLISQDHYVEGDETLALTLSNLTGGSTFGVPSTATLTIADDASEPATNPIDDAENFVRQHYHDFLNREPDPLGLAFWVNQITSCGADAQCIEVKRIHVSASFFLSIEFQDTGYLVERLYKVSYGDAVGNSTDGGTAHTLPVPIVKFNEFLPDTQKLAQGVIVGQPGWELVLENNKQAFVAEFVQRPQFATAFPTTMSPALFVDAMFTNAGITPTPADRQAAINEFGAAVNTTDLAARGRAVRRVAENSTLATNEMNRAFVLMEFFGYLRRNPNAAQDIDHSGYDFWLKKLNQFNGDFIQAEMVKGFLSSIEYRHRFGP